MPVGKAQSAEYAAVLFVLHSELPLEKVSIYPAIKNRTSPQLHSYAHLILGVAASTSALAVRPLLVDSQTHGAKYGIASHHKASL